MAETSRLKDLLAFLTSIRGDLANITSPPHLLAPKSVTEIAGAWTERPSVFVAPTQEDDPQKRALLVTKWILSSFKSQYNVGGNGVDSGIKKPLNAFLGELFFGQWTENDITTRMTTEQVSHHPPVTASYMWNNEYGIRGQGYTRVEMTFDGSVNIKQNGHAIVHIDRFDEDYLIPVPDAKVKGFFSGSLHLELDGTYYIVSSTGFVTEIRFNPAGTGTKSFFSSSSSSSDSKTSFEADLYRRDDPAKKPLYSIHGHWDGAFAIHDAATDTLLETWDPATAGPPAPLQIPNLDAQNPWESRRAWAGVLAAVREGNMSATVAEKSKIENAQRAMRKAEAAKGHVWEPHFFSSSAQRSGGEAGKIGSDGHPTDPIFENLAAAVNWQLRPEKTAGIWRARRDRVENPMPPYHGDVASPLG